MKDLRLLLPLFLLILIIFIFTGCGGVIPSPGTTDDFTTISGQIKMPLDCCTILPEEANSISKTAETCDESDLWSVTPGAIVELKSAEKGKCNKVLDTTIADETGNYVFEDVKPGLYIITAYCPVEDDKGFLTKDVAEKLSGQALDAGIPDCTSTALALVIEKINDCYDEHYQCFNKYSEAYKMVKGIAQDIGTVDISAIISHDDFGSYCDEEGDDLVDVICAWPCCIGPGTTGGGGNITPTPTYNLKMAVEPEGSGIATDKTGKSPYRKNTEVNILAAPNEGWKFTGWTVADDTKSLSRAPAGSFTDASKANTTFTMPANDVIVTANFVGQCAGNTAPVITVPDNAKVDPNPTEPYTWTVTATDTDGILGTLTYSLDSVSPTPANGFTINATTGVVSWDPTCEDIGEGDTTYTITVSVSDGCASDQGSFKITLLAEQCENYTVTFDKNHEDASGYTEADPKTKSVLYGSNVGTLPTAPTRTGYTFINWNTQPGGGGTEFTATTAVTDDITVYAQWEDILTYNVTYDGNGNTGGTAPEDSTDYQEDDEVTVLGPLDLVKTGYTFSHWNKKSDGTGETFYQGDTFDMPGNDVTLYARWKADIFDDFEPLTIAFEDLPKGPGNDYDYNDWVVKLQIDTEYEDDTPNLKTIKFKITPEARGSGLDHAFHIKFPFSKNGNYTLDGGTTVNFNDSEPLDIPVVGSTKAVLPAPNPSSPDWHCNGQANTWESCDYVNPTTIELTINFDDAFYYDFSDYDPYSSDSMHGEGLFFDPYLVVDDDYIIDGDDVRKLTVPTDWLWPEEQIAIWDVYSDVSEDSSGEPDFDSYWWDGGHTNGVYEKP